MNDSLLLLIALLSLGIIILIIVLLKRTSKAGSLQFETQFTSFEKNQDRLERSLKDEIARNREEMTLNAKQLREEIINSMTRIANLQKEQLDIFSKQLTTLTASNEDKLEKMKKSVEDSLHKMRETIEGKLKQIQDDSSEKLEKMRVTVDEKLHKTLEERLGQSFKIVSERLEQVHKGLGEMQNLAVGVGDLKKVLSNVKTRGILGELQLGNILEQILTPDQYSHNVATKKGSRENVEFAIILPGKDDSDEVVYLPLDSKFPLENYHSLISAYEVGDPVAVEEASKNIDLNIKKCAKDIRDKYIDPPNTTDFGILFLPIEGLYAEIVKRTSLIEILQREYKIIITGPTTLAAILNSLQMGFKTLAIEKRSSEVWKILGAVKTEFDKFGGVLKKAQEKIIQASSDIDDLVGTRTRQIQRKLKNVQELPTQESKLYLSNESVEAEDDDDQKQ
jgi:DNA recombination protein RmuC